ncbi:MAG TPA: Ig-like domain repeat protein [Edaphobacter sp.]|nr:Ig-like domain repeat protein [Edaphobacter sp.]
MRLSAMVSALPGKIWVALICCLLCLAATPGAVCQAPYVFSPAVPVNSTMFALSIPVTVQTAGTFGRVKVLTQGAPNLDFTDVAEICPSPAIVGQTCNVSVNFSPKFPGLRTGAIVILDTAGNVMASRNLSGFGIGSLSVMAPGKITTLAGDGCLNDGPCSTSGSTPATQAAMNLPLGQATDATGNLYVSDTGNNRIEKVDAAGNITVVAGNSEIAGTAGDGGPALSAQVNAPSTLLVDGAGNIIFADTGNDAIRKIDAVTGNISTIAGTLGTAGNSSTLLSSPQGFAFDAAGNLYIADTGNNRIVKIDTAGTVTTLPGTYNQPWSVAISSKDGGIYVADFGSNRILKIDTVGNVTTVAGTGAASYSGDGQLATAATLNHPASIVLDPADNIYIADTENNAVRKVNASTGKIDTLAGNGTALFGGDGFSAKLAGLYKPYSLYLDGAGNLFLSDRLDLRIREVSATVAAIQFPTMKEGKTSAPIAQTIENDGNAALNLTDLMAAPATQNAGLDPGTTTCSTTAPMPIGANCVLGVEFKPTTVSPITGEISISSDSGNSPIQVDLSGTVLSVDPTSTTILSSSNPAAVSQGVTFTAKISSPNNVTGTVQFYDGGVALGGPQTVDSASNSAAITWSFTTLGTHVITAVYSGDDKDAASDPNTPLNQVIQQATALNVVPSSNPATQFSPITFTATLTGWTTPPTGSINFTDGATSLGAATLNGSGVAVFPVPPLAVGAHNITATFAGDANDFSSQYSFTETVNRAPTSTLLSASATTVQYSTPVTFTATVTGVPASTPTGDVVFKDGASILATVPVNSAGVATYVNSTLAAGTHMITAAYQGNADYDGSTSTNNITVTVQQTASSTVISASTTNSIATRPVTLTARVSASGAVPTGTVNFMNGNVLIGTGTLNNGVVSIVTASLPVGTNLITAAYGGNSNDGPSTSPALAITVVQAPTTTAISSSLNPVQTLTPVVISAAVANGGTQSATGLVTFTEDGVAIGVSRLNGSGIATISIPQLPAGSHTFTAAYAGDSLNLPSTSGPLVQTVQLRPTIDTLTTSTTSLSGGQQLTLISVVRPNGTAGSVAPTGTVTFMSGSVTLATIPLDSTGVATVTVLLPGTSANLSSTYSGDANYATSSSTPSTVPIGPAPDFSLNATPITFQLQSTQNKDIQVSLTSVRNFTDTFSFGCLGLPKDATCTFSNNRAKLPAGGVATVTLTLDTGFPLLGGTQASNDDHSTTKVAFACLLPGIFFLAFRRRGVRLLSVLVIVVGMFAVTSGLTGCGTIQHTGTPPGTYHFLISATGQTGVSQYVDVTVTVTK